MSLCRILSVLSSFAIKFPFEVKVISKKGSDIFDLQIILDRCWVFGLCCANPEVRSWLLDAELDFVSAVVSAMKNFYEELYVVRYGISVVHSLSCEDPTFLVERKCLTEVLSALNNFSEDSYIVSSSLKTLVNVALQQNAKSAIIEGFMIGAVITCMKVFVLFVSVGCNYRRSRYGV